MEGALTVMRTHIQESLASRIANYRQRQWIFDLFSRRKSKMREKIRILKCWALSRTQICHRAFEERMQHETEMPQKSSASIVTVHNGSCQGSLYFQVKRLCRHPSTLPEKADGQYRISRQLANCV
jgi:hypothetical protein